MLSQRSIQLWEGYSSGVIALRENNVDTKPAYSCPVPLRQWRAHLQRRRRVRVNPGRKICAVTIVCSRGILAAHLEPLSRTETSTSLDFVRGAGDGGPNSLCLYGDDVRIASGLSARGDARPAINFNDGHEGLDYEDGLFDGRIETATEAPASAPSLIHALTRVSLRSPEGDRPDSDTSRSADSEDTLDSDRSSGSAVQDVNSTGAKNIVNKPSLLEAPKKDLTSLERFARARAAGRELVRKSQEGSLGSAKEEGIYYNPKVGDYVMGIVASGNFGKLDIDIGAKKLGHLFRKDVMPLDICNVRDISWEFPDSNSPESNVVLYPTHGPRFVHDDEVLNLALEAPMAVELGTVLTMEVKGITPSGRALLCARSIAREYAWQRVRQLNEYNATLEVQITEWTTAGLVAKIEGLRAFLPLYYLVNHPPEPSSQGSASYNEYVGQKFTVMISSVDEKRSNLVISEKKAWMAKHAYIGALVEGIVTEPIQPYGVHLRIKNTDISGVLHISNISRARVDNISNVFSIGEEVKLMVVPSNKQRRLSFSTADLEIEDGLMLRDKKAVFQDAESIAVEIAKAYKIKDLESFVDHHDHNDVVGKEIVIANWDWLDFGDKTELDQ